MLATFFLFGLVLIATVTDLTRHKIYNWTTYSGILGALSLNAVGTALLSARVVEEEQLRRVFGWIGVAESAVGLLACGFVMLVCYVLFRIGGGDVKLMAMLGAMLGPEDGIETMLWTFVLGGCVGLITLIWRVGALRLVVRVFRQIAYSLRLGWWSPLTEEERRELQSPLFLAPNVLVAAVIVRFSLLDFIM